MSMPEKGFHERYIVRIEISLVAFESCEMAPIFRNNTKTKTIVTKVKDLSGVKTVCNVTSVMTNSAILLSPSL